MLYSRLCNNKVEIICKKTEDNLATIEANTIFTKGYYQTFWLPMRWMQVIYGNLYQEPYPIDYQRQI